MSLEILNFINGGFQSNVRDRWIPVSNPALGEVIGRVVDSSKLEVATAVEAAGRAFPAWSKQAAKDRSLVLRKMGDLIAKHSEELAQLETLNTGKAIATSRSVDIPRAAANFHFFADAITQWSSEAHSMDAAAINYTLRQALGPVACISPWNLPLYLLTWKIAPALATGNTVVAKPSEVTPLTAHYLGRIAQEAGLPKGVLNIVHGQGAEAGAEICAHPLIKAISFTGSTRVGREIAKNSAGDFKKVSLELGGKNATLVFADCDFSQTVRETARAAFSNQGQICLCGSRIYVEKSLYSNFRDALIQEIKQLPLGDPMDPQTKQGSLVSKMHFEKVCEAVELAKREGATILCGGKPAQMPGILSQGYFYPPTLLENLSAQSKTQQEEIFGPVATLTPFETGAEAVELANNTRYGLAASVWTSNIDRGHQVAAQLQCGLVWVNTWMMRDLRTPFGGIKESGIGREGGADALRFFTESKNVCIGLKQGDLS